MTHWLFILLLLLAPLFGTAATAAEPADDLFHLHQIHLATQGSLGDLYLLYGDPDPSPASSIERRIGSTRTRLAALGTRPTNLLVQLQEQWALYARLLSYLAHEQQSKGNLDARALAELVALKY